MKYTYALEPRYNAKEQYWCVRLLKVTEAWVTKCEYVARDASLELACVRCLLEVPKNKPVGVVDPFVEIGMNIVFPDQLSVEELAECLYG